jgi:hypothetical protein
MLCARRGPVCLFCVTGRWANTSSPLWLISDPISKTDGFPDFTVLLWFKKTFISVKCDFISPFRSCMSGMCSVIILKFHANRWAAEAELDTIAIYRQRIFWLQSSPANRRFDPSTLPQYGKIPKRSLFPGQSTMANARALAMLTCPVTSASHFGSVVVYSYQWRLLSSGI